VPAISSAESAARSGAMRATSSVDSAALSGARRMRVTGIGNAGGSPSSRRVSTSRMRGEPGPWTSSASRVRLSASAHCRSSIVISRGWAAARVSSRWRRPRNARARSSSRLDGNGALWRAIAGTRSRTGNVCASAVSSAPGGSSRVSSSSRSSVRAIASTTPSSALNGTASRSWQRPLSTSGWPGRVAARARKCRTSLVLPIPDSPSIEIARVAPAVTSASARSSVASSAARPTNGVSAERSSLVAASARSTSAPVGRSAGSMASSDTQSCDRSAGASAMRRGGRRCCLRIRISSAEPSIGSRPVNASYSMTPTEYQSDGGPGGRDIACSGDMYAAVPTTDVSDSGASASATRPKSSSTTRPSFVTITFDGLRSRWIIPAPWRASRPLASWRSAARSRLSS